MTITYTLTQRLRIAQGAGRQHVSLPVEVVKELLEALRAKE